MQGSLRSLAVQLQPWPATLCVLTPAELVIPAARSIATWIGTPAVVSAGASQPACAEIRGAARYLCTQPHRAQHCSSVLPPSGLSSNSAAISKAPAAEVAQLHRTRDAHGSQWRSHAGWSCQALALGSSPSPPQPVTAATCSASPDSAAGPGSGAARSRQRSRQRDSGACSRGLATEAGPQLLDSAGRPIVTGRRSADFRRLADNAEEKPDARVQAADPQQTLASEAVPGDAAQPEIAIDRSGLRSLPDHEHGGQPHKGPETALLRHLKALIRVQLGYVVHPVSFAPHCCGIRQDALGSKLCRHSASVERFICLRVQHTDGLFSNYCIDALSVLQFRGGPITVAEYMSVRNLPT